MEVQAEPTALALGEQTEPDLWKWDLDMTGDYRPQVPEPSLQPHVPFQPRLLLQEVILAHCPSQPHPSVSGSPLTKPLADAQDHHRAWQLLIQAALWAPSMNERDILEALVELTSATHQPGGLDSTQLMVQRSEMAPAIRVKSPPP